VEISNINAVPKPIAERSGRTRSATETINIILSEARPKAKLAWGQALFVTRKLGWKREKVAQKKRLKINEEDKINRQAPNTSRQHSENGKKKSQQNKTF
jgi:hypothetical protein